MSFGFAIGDFIAVAELAHKLWHDVYMVARTAPEEVRSLSSELSVLSQSIRLLVEHASNPDSILVKAGQDRVQLVNTMIEGTNDTLLRLESFAKKHQLVGSEAPSKFRRGFNKLRYVNDASDINKLRSRLVYHNGVLNLLLTSIGNSSLERMETENQKIAANVIEIKQQISSIFRLPVATSHVDEETQLEVSQIFLEKVEIERPWYSFGIDVWIQAGKWWLNKALFILRKGTSVDNEVDPQAYVDLLKASWILTDILQDHPQRTFLHKGSQQLELMALSNTIRKELEKCSRPVSRRPNLEKITACDMSIWVITPMGALNLGEERGTAGLGFHLLCERYGVYFSQDDTMRSECIFKLWMRKAADEQAVYLTARTASDIAILSHRLSDKFKFVYPRGLQRSSLNGKEFVCLTLDLVYADHKIRQHTLWFNSVEDAMIFQALLDGALHYLKWFRNGSLSPASLHSISLLKLIARLNIHQLGSGADAIYFESPAEERLYIELLVQERNNIWFGEENQLWTTTMKILQQYLNHGPQGHWPTMRSIRNKGGITHQWYTVQIMQMEGPESALKLLGNEGAEISTNILEFLFAAGVQRNFQWIDKILRVASAENIQLHLDDIVKSFYRSDLVVACKVHMRAFWDPKLRILLTDYANLLGPELRSQYVDLSLAERCMALYTFWCPGISSKISESQCSLCSRYPYHATAEFQEGDGIPTIGPEIS